MQRENTKGLRMKIKSIEIADLLSPQSMDGVDPVCEMPVDAEAR